MLNDCRNGLVVSLSFIHAVGCGFAPRPGHTKDHQWYKLPRCLTCKIGSETQFCKRPVACETVYGDIHLKDLLGSIARLGYCIPIPDFYLVLHGL